MQSIASQAQVLGPKRVAVPCIHVIAGLDPAIYLYATKMDPPVKPAGDAQRVDQLRRKKL